jgi:hypothetical protein
LPCAGRREAEGVAFTKLGDFFGDALAINRQREGEADLRIGEWRTVDVEAREVAAEEGAGVEIRLLLELFAVSEVGTMPLSMMRSAWPVRK